MNKRKQSLHRKTVNEDKSIYTDKTDAGKGDKPRQVTKQYEKNYTEIFPNAFKPKWQTELENENLSKTQKLN